MNLSLIVQEFNYSFFDQWKTYKFGMKRQGADEYQLVAEGYPMKAITENQDIFLPNPIKNYGFPSQTYTYYPQSIFLSEFVLELEKLFQNIYYLGPLREYPRRSYLSVCCTSSSDFRTVAGVGAFCCVLKQGT